MPGVIGRRGSNRIVIRGVCAAIPRTRPERVFLLPPSIGVCIRVMTKPPLLLTLVRTPMPSPRPASPHRLLPRVVIRPGTPFTPCLAGLWEDDVPAVLSLSPCPTSFPLSKRLDPPRVRGAAFTTVPFTGPLFLRSCCRCCCLWWLWESAREASSSTARRMTVRISWMRKGQGREWRGWFSSVTSFCFFNGQAYALGVLKQFSGPRRALCTITYLAILVREFTQRHGTD